jgi:phage-related protein
VKPDTKGFGAKLSEGIKGESGGLGAVGAHLGGLLMAGLGTVGIAVGVGEFIKKGVEEYSQADALNAQFAAGITSTNNAAGLTVKGMDELAASISGYSGQAYASIGKTEQILQTFTNIKNVGPNKIFDETTTAAANMAAKLGGDASQSAMQLGIALNDPIKGVARLHRVGVAFTQSQMDQIKAMQKSGDMMGAQSVILKELNTEFGGAAKAAGETLPGEIARSKVAFGELTKAVVGGVMPFVTPVIEGIANAMNRATPSIEKFSEGFRDKLGEGLKELHPLFVQIGDAFKQMGPTFAPLIGQVASLASNFSPLSLILKAIVPVLPQIASVVSVLAQALVGALGNALKTLLPAIGQLAKVLAGALGAAITTLVPVIVQLVGVLGPILGKVISALLPVISSIVKVLAGDFGGVIKILLPVIATLAQVLGHALGDILIQLSPIIVMLAKFIGQVFEAISPLIPVVLQLVMAFLPLLTPLIQLAEQILTPLIGLFTTLLTPILGLVTSLVQMLMPVITVLIQALAAILPPVLKALMPIISAVASIFGDILGPAIHGITEVLGGIIDFISGVFTGNWSKAWKGITEIFSGIWDGLTGIVKGIVNGIIDLIDGVIGGINSLGGAVGIHVGLIPHLAEGATVLPTPGGTVVRVAEGGKAESVVDTGKLNRLIDQATNGAPARGHGDILPNATIVMQKEHSVAEYAQELGFLQRVYG